MQAAGAEAGNLSPGGELRAAREARGLSVHQAAQELHVSDLLIDAMERGDYPVLGEPVFVRGHLRNYARALGLPEAQVLSAYEQTQNKPPPPSLVTQHVSGMSPRAREWVLRAASAGVLLLLLSLAVSWWLHRPDEPVEALSATRSVVTPLPPAVTTAVTVVADLAAAPAGVQKHEPAQTAPPPAKPATTAATRVERSRPAVTPPATVQPAQTTAQAGIAQNLTHARFSMNAASWIEVYDAAGKRLYYDLAPAGESVDVNGAGPLQVFLGNAPGVSIELDGAAFSLAPFVRVDNTARFKLGTPGN